MVPTFHDAITEINADEWDVLWPSQYPFTKHAFLAALESSNSVDVANSASTGWQVKHLSLSDNGRLVAAMPLFIKTHSYGEYVFDWSWANAYHQAGLDYYPKLINAIPFTPATGPRVGFSPDLSPADREIAFQTFLSSIRDFMTEYDFSGFHTLFPEKKENSLWQTLGESRRVGYQFHWFNQNYQNFDHFLESFSSRKRKNLKKERNKVINSDMTITMRDATVVPPNEWDEFYALYHRTYLKRSGRAGYLGPDFFHTLAETMPEQVLLASAHVHDTMVAAAFYLRDEHNLYGRYWGTKMDIDGLHFECCYYQGIEYAIKHKLKRFDPGAQGEHKIQRGFTPIKTHSYHQIMHPAFNRAIQDFVQREAKEIDFYIRDTRTLMPFKEGVDAVSADTLIDEPQTS